MEKDNLFFLKKGN